MPIKSPPRPPPIALIGFPLLEMEPNPATQALAGYILQDKGWEIALVAKEGAGGIRLAEKMGCAGALVRLLSPEVARAARTARIPLVNVSGWLPAPGVETVKTDNAAIGRLAAAHLQAQKFTRLALIVAPGGAFNRDRETGFVAQAATQGMPVDVFRGPKKATREGAVDEAALAVWLRGLRHPTGLFLTDDTLALRVIALLHAGGLSVPQNVGLVCGPLHPERGALCTPTLTQIDANTPEVYRRAVDRLDELMRRRRPAKPVVELIEPLGLFPGESTRLPACEDPLVARAIGIMDGEAGDGLNITELCTKLGVASATLGRHFKAATGQMPHDYLTRLRIATARHRLATTGESIEKVATACGFTNRKRLNLVFSAKEGVSPRTWRNRQRTKAAEKESI